MALGLIGGLIGDMFKFATMPSDELRNELRQRESDTTPTDVDKNASWDDYGKIDAFRSGQISAYCRMCNFRFDVSTPSKRVQSPPNQADQTAKKTRSVEDRLKEAERLLANGTITEVEYKNKRAEILKDL
jgi:hypothetical protein